MKSSKVETNTGAKIIVSSISESILNSMPLISSGFKPGIDDWEFVNNGSYIAPRGHCAGQDMAAMWYYFEKKETEGGLYNKYSAVPAIQADNAIGYRFCSVLQKDIDPNNTGAVNSLFWGNIDRNQDLDQLKIFSIAGAMLVTGEPQGISIYRQSGTDADGYPTYNGHDLICYQMGMVDGVMYISDPNTPGNGQKIEFKGGRFEPYSAKLNGNATSEEYKYITWYAKTAWIDWGQLGNRFKELTDSTIGNQAPDNFPAYTIWVKGKTDTKLTNGFTISSDTLRCYVECPKAELAYPENGKRLTRFSMHDENGYKIDVGEINRKYYVLLKPGLNKIGFFITARKEGVLDLAGNICDLYVDYKWFNVYFSKLKISPNPITGDPDKDIKITAMSDGTAPKSAKYVWSFGDGTKEVTVKNDSIVKHKFPKDGTYTVLVKLYDNSTDKIVGTAAARATIGATCSDGSFEYEGRSYGYKLIGTQTWMTENLAYLPSASPASATSNVIPNYHVYDYAGTSVSDAMANKNYDTYGVLYNWTAAQTACPPGWHLPSNGEWSELANYLGGKAVAGGKIKEAGTAHWGGENTGTNESCFTALPGGFHSYDGKFYSLTGMAYFWSSTAVDKFSAWSRVLFENKVDITDWPYVKDYALSVRCVKDN